MKNIIGGKNMISLLLASMLFANSPADIQNNSLTSQVEITNTSFQLGSDVVQKVRNDYSNGKYTKFLKQMDEEFIKAKGNGELEGLTSLRKENAKVMLSPNFIQSYESIQQEKAKDLLDLVSDSNDPIFVKKVQSAVSKLTLDEKKILDFHNKVPSPQYSNEENKLIEIELEYYSKIIHFDSHHSNDKLRKEKILVLNMEKMGRMVEASKQFKDQNLKTSVENTAKLVDQRLAKTYDMNDLSLMARGKVKPSTPLEQKVAASVALSQDKLAKLHRDELLRLDDLQTAVK